MKPSKQKLTAVGILAEAERSDGLSPKDVIWNEVVKNAKDSSSISEVIKKTKTVFVNYPPVEWAHFSIKQLTRLINFYVNRVIFDYLMKNSKK